MTGIKLLMSEGNVDYRRLRLIRILDGKQESRNSFIVLSYNVMAQHHIWSDVLPPCPIRPNGILKWSYRRMRLSSEIMSYSFDIGAFQEMFKWNEYFREWFDRNGFEGRFIEKGQDGCAVVWRRNRFEAECVEEMRFEAEMPTKEAHANVALIVRLRDKELGRRVVVACTHLYWVMDHEDVRLRQAHRLRKRLEEMVGPEDVLILMGDLNCSPQSVVYRWLTGMHSGNVDEEMRSSDFMERINRIEEGIAKDFIEHWQPLHSVYSQYNGTSSLNDGHDGGGESNGEPLFTTYNPEFKGCLDYILINDKVKATRLLMMPHEKLLKAQIALPNELYVSDHLALVATLDYKTD